MPSPLRSTLLLTRVTTGSKEAEPTVLDEPCEFDSCPSGSPAVGFNATQVSIVLGVTRAED